MATTCASASCPSPLFPQIPEPCLTCGKEQNPERFHSHPLDIMKFKPKTEERAKARALSKLIVTKPTALKYKSRGIDTENKAPAGRKSKQKPSTANKKSRSVDNSPAPAKKGQSAIPLKKFISEQKASMNKDKEFTVEIFDAQTSPRSEDSSSPPQPQRRREPSKQNGETERKKGAPPPPRHMNKIEEERESRPEETTKTRRPENGSRGGQRLGTVPTLVCYICGREFGSRSLAIHQPQCLEVKTVLVRRINFCILTLIFHVFSRHGRQLANSNIHTLRTPLFNLIVPREQ